MGKVAKDVAKEVKKADKESQRQLEDFTEAEADAAEEK